jgi:hypothetical protein
MTKKDPYRMTKKDPYRMAKKDPYRMTTGEQATAIAKTATATAIAASSGLENDEDQQVVGRVRWVRVRACMQSRR